LSIEVLQRVEKARDCAVAERQEDWDHAAAGVARKTQSDFLSELLGTVVRASDCVVAEGRPSPFRTLSPWPRFIMGGAFFGFWAGPAG